MALLNLKQNGVTQHHKIKQLIILLNSLLMKKKNTQPMAQ